MLLRLGQLVGIGPRKANHDGGAQVFVGTLDHLRTRKLPNGWQALQQPLREVQREFVLLEIGVNVKQSKLDLEVARISLQGDFEVVAGQLRLSFVGVRTTNRGEHVNGRFVRLRRSCLELFDGLGRAQPIRERDDPVVAKALPNLRLEIISRQQLVDIRQRSVGALKPLWRRIRGLRAEPDPKRRDVGFQLHDLVVAGDAGVLTRQRQRFPRQQHRTKQQQRRAQRQLITGLALEHSLVACQRFGDASLAFQNVRLREVQPDAMSFRVGVRAQDLSCIKKAAGVRVDIGKPDTSIDVAFFTR